MRVNSSDACELVGFIGIALAVAMLAGLWWGVLVASIFVVVVGLAWPDHRPMPPTERNE